MILPCRPCRLPSQYIRIIHDFALPSVPMICVALARYSRVEMNALALSRRNHMSPILIKGPEASPVMISVAAGLSRTPGNGQFTCCSRRHEMTIAGVLKAIPCDRSSIGSVVWKMLRSKHKDLRRRRRKDESRLWRAFTPHFMQGLTCEEMDASVPAVSVNEFLQEYGIAANETRGVISGIWPSGVSALLLSAMAGNAGVVRELAQRNPSDVTARVRSDFRSLGITAGMTPLHLAVSFCATNHTEIVTSLLAYGADPNAAFDKAKIPPLYCAAWMSNLAGLKSLLFCAGDRLHIEQKNTVNSDTALGGAAYAGTLAIVDALLAANANPGHIH